METLIGTPDPEPYDHDKAAADYREKYEEIMSRVRSATVNAGRFPRPAKSKR